MSGLDIATRQSPSRQRTKRIAESAEPCVVPPDFANHGPNWQKNSAGSSRGTESTGRDRTGRGLYGRLLFVTATMAKTTAAEKTAKRMEMDNTLK